MRFSLLFLYSLLVVEIIMETIIEEVACRLKMDANEIRRINFYSEGGETYYVGSLPSFARQTRWVPSFHPHEIFGAIKNQNSQVGARNINANEKDQGQIFVS